MPAARPATRTPAARPTAKPAAPPTEDAIQFAVIAILQRYARPGVVFWHTANEGATDAASGARLKRMGVKAGVPDIFVLIGGRLHGLELKTDRGGLSQDQRATHAELKAAGAVVATAHSIADARNQLIAWRAIQRPAS
jgi:hypothetical protein